MFSTTASSLITLFSAVAAAMSSAVILVMAFDGDVVDGDGGVEAEGGHDGGLVGRVVTLDVAGRIGFGVSLGLGVLEHVIEVEALGGHLVENVVGGAVDDAEHARHLVSDEGFAQRLEERDGAAHGGFEVDVDALGFGGA